MTEINLFPKFLDNALSPVATTVGNTLSSVWNLVFGGIDSYSQKIDHKRMLNLEQFKQELDDKVSAIPDEKIVEPPLHILGPALESSKFYFENDQLRNMFSNLIASSINKDSVALAHPSFVEVIKQLNSDEAKILRLLNDEKSKAIVKIKAYNKENNHFAEPIQEFSMLPYIADCDYPDLGPSYLVNIARLGLASIKYGTYSTLPNSYEPIYNHQVIVQKKALIEKLGKRAEIERGTFTRTTYGETFYKTCITEK